MNGKNKPLLATEFGEASPTGKAENPLYRPLDKAENPRKVVQVMRLDYVRPDFAKVVKEKPLHFSGYINIMLKKTLKKDLSTMAIWTRGQWMVVAWVES